MAISAAVVLVLSMGAGLYIKGRIDAAHAAKLKTMEAQVAQYEHDLATIKRATEADALRAQINAQVIENYEEKVTDLLGQLDDANRECLTPGDTDRVRGLWETGKDATPKRPR